MTFSREAEFLYPYAGVSVGWAINHYFPDGWSSFFSFIIIRMMRYMPTGQASSAAMLKNPLASAPSDIPKSVIAAIRSSGAAQHRAIVSPPLSHPFFFIEQTAVFSVAPTSWRVGNSSVREMSFD